MRVKRGVTARKRHKKILKQTKGMQGLRRHSIKKAKEALVKAQVYAYRDRRNRKRDFRSIWIARIGAAARLHDLTYREFIHLLGEADVEIDRKMLADLAVREPAVFKKLVDEVSPAKVGAEK